MPSLSDITKLHKGLYKGQEAVGNASKLAALAVWWGLSRISWEGTLVLWIATPSKKAKNHYDVWFLGCVDSVSVRDTHFIHFHLQSSAEVGYTAQLPANRFR